MPSAEEAPSVTSLPVDAVILLLGSIRDVNTGHDGHPSVFTPDRGLDNEAVVDFGEQKKVRLVLWRNFEFENSLHKLNKYSIKKLKRIWYVFQ